MSNPAQLPGFINLRERLRIRHAELDAREWQLLCDLRVAMPGIVQEFNSGNSPSASGLLPQCVNVQPAIYDNVNKQLVLTPTKLPLLINCPVVLFRAGGMAVTMPIQEGDECLVIFNDFCIDSWFESGNDDNVQLDRRRHDLSDGMAIVGIWNQKRLIDNYSTASIQIRSDDGTMYVDVGMNGDLALYSHGFGGNITLDAANTITLSANNVTLQASSINIQGGTFAFTGSSFKINGKEFATHTHSGVQTGGGNTGPVV